MYCPVFDDTCPYYLENGKCQLGSSAYEECDDAYAILGDDWEESYSYEEPFAVYDPGPPEID